MDYRGGGRQDEEQRADSAPRHEQSYPPSLEDPLLCRSQPPAHGEIGESRSFIVCHSVSSRLDLELGDCPVDANHPALEERLLLDELCQHVGKSRRVKRRRCCHLRHPTSPKQTGLGLWVWRR